MHKTPEKDKNSHYQFHGFVPNELSTIYLQ